MGDDDVEDVRIGDQVVRVRFHAEPVPVEIAGRTFELRFTARALLELDRRYRFVETPGLATALQARPRETVLELLGFALQGEYVDGEPVEQWLAKNLDTAPTIGERVMDALKLHVVAGSEAIRFARAEQEQLDEQLNDYRRHGQPPPEA